MKQADAENARINRMPRLMLSYAFSLKIYRRLFNSRLIQLSARKLIGSFY